MHRPYFDWKIEYEQAEDENEDEDEDGGRGKYKKNFEEEEATGNIFQPATEHKEWKWTMLWEGWTTFRDFEQKIYFCNPDNFGMHIYNDWSGYGVTEAVENILVAFDGALKKKDENRLFRMWAIITAIAHWLNDEADGGMAFIRMSFQVHFKSYSYQTATNHSLDTDDGDRAKMLNALIGCALLTALHAIESAGELNPTSKFLDLPIIISSFLEWSSDLEQYGIEEEAVFWRSHAVEYFNKATPDPSRGIFGTDKLLKKLKEDDDDYEEDLSGRTKNDPWAWGKKLKQYKAGYGPRIGGSEFNITKMTRKERAQYAFDGQDPFKDVPEKDIKKGNFMFV
jgi:hypothetical protein